jgi:hypothetical protein
VSAKERTAFLTDDEAESNSELCGACGRYHGDRPGTCELDDRAATQVLQEHALREALYSLNRTMGAWTDEKSPALRHGVPAVLIVARDDLWELGQTLFGWVD